MWGWGGRRDRRAQWSTLAIINATAMIRGLRCGCLLPLNWCSRPTASSLPACFADARPDTVGGGSGGWGAGRDWSSRRARVAIGLSPDGRRRALRCACHRQKHQTAAAAPPPYLALAPRQCSLLPGRPLRTPEQHQVLAVGFEPTRSDLQWISSPPPQPLGQTSC